MQGRFERACCSICSTGTTPATATRLGSAEWQNTCSQSVTAGALQPLNLFFVYFDREIMIQLIQGATMGILYEKRERVAYITINRPEARNAIDLETAEELSNAWTDFRDDDNLWIAVITGAGDKSFSAGADLKSFIPMLTGQSQSREQASRGGFGGITQGFECWKPIIAAINGHCFAGGFEIMLACDLRIASENSVFGQTEVRLGIIPGAGGTQRLPRAIPLAKAMEIILMGESITAEGAYRIGMI